MASPKAHPDPRYFSSIQKGGNILAKASKLTIDVPENDDDTASNQIFTLNKNSPSHSRGTLNTSKIPTTSGTPKHKAPVSKQQQPKQIHSEGNTPTSNDSSFNFPSKVKKSAHKAPPVFAVKSNLLSAKGTSPRKSSQKPSTPTGSKNSPGLPPRPKTVTNKAAVQNIEIKPETGSSPSLNIYVTQVQKPASAKRIKKQLTEAEIEAKSEAYYKEHLFQTFQSLKLIRNLPPVEISQIREKRLNLPKRPGWENKKTAIFDLDETLVHCCDGIEDCDVVLPIIFPTGEAIDAGINVRPYTLECLREINKEYEIIVFTASHQCYADVVLDYLDPSKELIHHRLYRNNCVNVEGIYMKDLRIFANRKLKDMVIIDNSAYSFGNQLDNGVPIISWMDDYYDKELFNLIDYLKALAKVDDIRDINRQTFHLRTFYEDYIQEFLANEAREAKLARKNKREPGVD
ncbi:unnamed protein product [Blepharisma stoltei]|uniref:FCP1 homology domain-containing protein n=1 Tax=Blepharisma stoltei TaxID=1481888 RepID=A0AAU9J3H4_9CILI|nr:unnamed protein product [Blepharisma stoltei]